MRDRAPLKMQTHWKVMRNAGVTYEAALVAHYPYFLSEWQLFISNLSVLLTQTHA